jgi:very-short-patch-repair endonuclease
LTRSRPRYRAAESLTWQVENVLLWGPVFLEFSFHPERRWRFDLALPERMIAVEIEGAIWVQGRHTRGTGYLKDMEKYNEATRLGWRVFRFTPQQVKAGEALRFLEGLQKDVLTRKRGGDK